MRLLQVSEAIPSSPWEMVTHATPMAKVVLVVLAVLSLVSWAIMFAKWREFRALRAASRSFMSEFEHQTTLEQAQALAQRSTESVHAGLRPCGALPSRVARNSGVRPGGGGR